MKMYFLLKIEFFPASHVNYRECSNWILVGIYIFCSWKGIFPSAPNTFSGAIRTLKTCPNYTWRSRRVLEHLGFFPKKSPSIRDVDQIFWGLLRQKPKQNVLPVGDGEGLVWPDEKINKTVEENIPRTYNKLKESNWLLEFKPEFFRKVLSPRIFSFFSPGSQRCDREIFWFDSFLTLNPGV